MLTISSVFVSSYLLTVFSIIKVHTNLVMSPAIDAVTLQPYRNCPVCLEKIGKKSRIPFVALNTSVVKEIKSNKKLGTTVSGDSSAVTLCLFNPALIWRSFAFTNGRFHCCLN